jgi:hypothetical protein
MAVAQTRITCALAADPVADQQPGFQRQPSRNGQLHYHCAHPLSATASLTLQRRADQRIGRQPTGCARALVIDRLAWKDEQRPLIYRPWLEQAVELFKQFHDSDFSLAYIARYIEGRPYLFPYPPAEDLQKYNFPTIMTRVQKGYTITSIDAVKHYLSNLTLGGYAKVGRDDLGNEILLAGAFEAAVPMDLLAPCYGAITEHYPDGTPFDHWKDSRRSRKHTKQWESDAILHGLLAAVSQLFAANPSAALSTA